MSDYSLSQFVRETRAVIAADSSPAYCVEKIVPLMYRLLRGDKGFLKPEHYQDHPDHYSRNAIYVDDNDIMSLYALVWQPGQWTPIHDHGTWGVVGVHEGVLEERNFIRTDSNKHADLENIDLVDGGIILLPPDAVTSFVPSPDHIHFTGNPSADDRVVSLHLYGNAMAGFYIYDKEARTRKWVEISHNES